MNTLSNQQGLTIQGTMQSLRLNNNKRDKTMNSYFANTTNGDIRLPRGVYPEPYEILRSLRSLRMTSEGLRMTGGEGLAMTIRNC